MRISPCEPDQPGGRGAAGFTLFELLVVIAIISLLATAIVPSFMRADPRFELRKSAHVVATHMRDARSRAILRNTESFVEIDVVRGLIRASGGTDTRFLPQGATAKLVIGQAGQQSAERGRIGFMPDGGSSGGYVGLRSGREEIDVNVDWLTGRVNVEEVASR